MVTSSQDDEAPRKRRRRATSPEARERELTALAMDKVEERMRNGSATAAEYTHFLKLATVQAELEKEKTRSENELLKARVENLAMQARLEEVYSNALKAMKAYGGNMDEDEESYDD